MGLEKKKMGTDEQAERERGTNKVEMTNNHITRFEVKNFKKFDRLVVENIGQINLITGDNNVGKTSLLEVLLLEPEIEQILSALKYVYHSRSRSVRNYKNFNVGNEVETQRNNILGIFQNDVTRDTWFLRKFSNEYFDTIILRNIIGNVFDSNDASIRKFVKATNNWESSSRYSKNWIEFLVGSNIVEEKGELVRNGYRIDRLVDLTSSFYKDAMYAYHDFPFSKMIDYNLMPDNDDPFYENQNWIGVDVLDIFTSIMKTGREEKKLFELMNRIFHLKIDGIRKGEVDIEIRTSENDNYHSINLYGDGFIKVFRVILSIMRNNSSRLLIDEIDAGIHFSRLKHFWTNILELALETNTQLFCTSHSQDCIKALVDAGEEIDEMKSKLRLIELEEFKNDETLKHTATTYEFDALKYKLEVGTNVRGGDVWQ